jgi:hypothetical protein
VGHDRGRKEITALVSDSCTPGETLGRLSSNYILDKVKSGGALGEVAMPEASTVVSVSLSLFLKARMKYIVRNFINCTIRGY